MKIIKSVKKPLNLKMEHNHLEKNETDVDSLKRDQKKNHKKTINRYQKRSKNLTVKSIIFLLKKLIILL